MSDFSLTPEELARVEEGHREMMRMIATETKPIDLTKDESDNDSEPGAKDKKQNG